MTERKIIHLNQQFQIRVDYDLRDREITIYSQFRPDGESLECHGNDIYSAIDTYYSFDDDRELFEKILEVIQEINDWIDCMDIEALIAEHAQSEAEERAAETKEDMERNG